ncbi:unnamed protein product [Linum tenue]|uniref:Uncharacterized protein n=1 Tax=Linum tenue TaxID=586396 RepID=A0AAV0J0G5_9ROSI|nr:unnamed protein product [Linum tenue]
MREVTTRAGQELKIETMLLLDEMIVCS